jgi:hypothetical protein
LTGRYLPTFKVQEAGGNANLAKSQEVTALEVHPEEIIGAAVVQRSMTGSGSMANVSYQITLWEANAKHPGNTTKKRGKYIQETIKNYTGYGFDSLKGTKSVTAGMKASGNTASNAVLARAVEALFRPNTKIEKLSGARPAEEGVSSNVDALLDGHKHKKKSPTGKFKEV